MPQYYVQRSQVSVKFFPSSLFSLVHTVTLLFTYRHRGIWDETVYRWRWLLETAHL